MFCFVEGHYVNYQVTSYKVLHPLLIKYLLLLLIILLISNEVLVLLISMYMTVDDKS